MTELDFAFYSDVGGRSDNEDAYLAKQLPGGSLFIVADGLGGHDSGEMASSSAVHGVKEYLLRTPGADVAAAIQYANEVVLDLQQKLSSKMKTTVALALVTEEKTVIAHVGDTRVYAFSGGKILRRTLDHSASQLAVSVGEIRPEDIRTHEDRNILIRALGAGEQVKVDSFTLDNRDFSALLLCSDGFWEYVLEDEMESALASTKTAEKWLYQMRAIQLRKAPQKCDNNTAIAVMLPR